MRGQRRLTAPRRPHDERTRPRRQTTSEQIVECAEAARDLMAPRNLDPVFSCNQAGENFDSAFANDEIVKAFAKGLTALLPHHQPPPHRAVLSDLAAPER